VPLSRNKVQWSSTFRERPLRQPAYELRNIFGAIIGIRVNLAQGQKWARADEEASEW
jgi:hypothetical protein